MRMIKTVCSWIRKACFGVSGRHSLLMKGGFMGIRHFLNLTLVSILASILVVCSDTKRFLMGRMKCRICEI